MCFKKFINQLNLFFTILLINFDSTSLVTAGVLPTFLTFPSAPSPVFPEPERARRPPAQETLPDPDPDPYAATRSAAAPDPRPLRCPARRGPLPPPRPLLHGRGPPPPHPELRRPSHSRPACPVGASSTASESVSYAAAAASSTALFVPFAEPPRPSYVRGGQLQPRARRRVVGAPGVAGRDGRVGEALHRRHLREGCW
jgi:hypothetical protein